MQEAVWEQMDDDTDLEGLTLTERLARGVVMGTATGVGAFGAIALCMRFGATRKAVPVCGDLGALRRREGRRPDPASRRCPVTAWSGSSFPRAGSGSPIPCRGSPC